MALSEADTRAKLIDPAIYSRGWTEDHISREETLGAIEIVNGTARRRSRGRVDYTLRLRVNSESQPVAVALIEAKAEHLPPMHGLEQAKNYATAGRRLHVPFVFSSNGHLFVEYDALFGVTASPRPLAEFPTPDELRERYEQGKGFSLSDEAAKPLLAKYRLGEAGRRYYQDAAIRAVLEKIAACQKADKPQRALLSLATGSGKTFIAVELLRRIADAGQLRRALFVCDRDELRSQGLTALQNAFGADAQAVSGRDAQKNARVLVATYQTLGLTPDEDESTFLKEHYPPDYFSHIVIDECHRSAWGRWSEVLRQNPRAVQVGLTATPRRLADVSGEEQQSEDALVTADNLEYFGDPVYEYDMGQGIEDGYLAACEIVRRDIFQDDKSLSEREVGLDRKDLEGKTLVDSITGEVVGVAEARAHYEATAFEAMLMLPERVDAMCRDLFAALVKTGGPEQKTIVFCARDDHADRVAATINNLYAEWCAQGGRQRLDPYAFKCTASVQGSEMVADLRGMSRSHFIATTVELLTTGVDVPSVRNIVFFKYVSSPIAFYQMVGRGTRIHAPTGKLMFRVYDYTNATRLFGQDFVTKIAAVRNDPGVEPEPREGERTIVVQGFDVRVTEAGRYVVTQVDGRAMPITLEDYKAGLAARLVAEVPTLDQFREVWVNPPDRQGVLAKMPDAGRSALIVQTLQDMAAYDLYDVLADLAYGAAPRTRVQRADAFNYKHAEWLDSLPIGAAETLRALTRQFGLSGTDGLEQPAVFNTPDVVKAGGLAALRALGQPKEILRETKRRVFAA